MDNFGGHSRSLAVDDAEKFLRRATNWYFGGYLKMDTEKTPDPIHLITFLRVLGFREIKKEFPVARSPRKKNGYRIEITCDNPAMDVKMEFPEISSPAASPSLGDYTRSSPASRDISVGKLKVMKEVYSMMMEFLWDQDGTVQRKDKMLEQKQWRRCMSMSAMGPPCPQFCLPSKKPDVLKNRGKPCKEESGEVVVLDADGGCGDKGVKSSRSEVRESDTKQDEAMEVDLPSCNSSTLANNNLSPIGLARQRTWVLETSKAEELEFEKARTSTPTKPSMVQQNQIVKIGLNTAHGISKILRPRQARTEVQPQRLRSANAESLRTMTQMRDAKNLSSRIANKSKNSSVSSTSSVSSHSSVDATRSSAYRNSSSKLLAPPVHTITASGGARAKLPSHLGVNRRAPFNSESKTLAGVNTRSRRLVSLPQMKKEDQISHATNLQKKPEPVSVRKPCEQDQLTADEDKVGVKRRPSLLPRFRMGQKNLPPNKG